MNSYNRMIRGMEKASTRTERLAEVMVELVAEGGLEALSVRAVAQRGDVSIGTVQYHFPTKEAMLEQAFRQVVGRVSRRALATQEQDPVSRLVATLHQLLPLDDERLVEARVVMAFSAAAAVHPGLAAVQEEVLRDVLAALARCFAQDRGATTTNDQDRTRARVALATTDGLALHAISAPGTLSRRELSACVDELVSGLVSGPARTPTPAPLGDETGRTGRGDAPGGQ